ncbi:MAG: N-acetyltransferase family protein [Polyangiales bacterium]
MTKSDFDHLSTVMDRWWGGPGAQRAAPHLFHELGSDAIVAEDDGKMAGFLLGFLVPKSPPLGYIHLVGIHPDYRRLGVGQRLYARFEEKCRAAGARSLKAISPVGHEGALRFHEALGFRATVAPHYAGAGRARVVYERDLG